MTIVQLFGAAGEQAAHSTEVVFVADGDRFATMF